ncbi:gephyrin-like molybdotransferase Glp [Celerinatantimonas sp. YJH-8]|uniref:molybdopterin molybdotransferase MoeA n=1 Tax=Celerinatantimonas sp. YJH-8 TaxID=3228714 RepID=UPI0038C79A80
MDSCAHPSLMSVEQALSHLLEQLSVKSETAKFPIEKSHGHYLADSATAQTDIPSFANSAMDGYAFAYDDLANNSSLEITHHILAGDTTSHQLNAGECARIMTGAPLPIGADTVVMQERTEVNDNHMSINGSVKKGENVRLPGESIAQGTQVALSGDKISAAHIGLFASIGLTSVQCFKPLTIGIFSTGDELKQPGQPLEFGQIYDSNRAMLAAILHQLPVQVIDYGAINDDLEAITQVLATADKQCDAVISSAGVSVGTADFTKTALETLGQIEFWKVAMKPGKPFAFGRLSNSVFFGLPGNPVSAMVTFLQLVVPALTKLGGGKVHPSVRWPAIATTPFKKRPGRTDFQRAIAHVNAQGHWEVQSSGFQGSATLTTFIGANCFAVLEKDRGPVSKGEIVQIEMIPSILTA